MQVRLAPGLLPAILLTGFLSSCQAPYHQKEESYVFVAFNTSLQYWQEEIGRASCRERVSDTV